MSGQLQFGGVIPFNDRASGAPVQVNVWGTFVGTGVDAHEESAIQQWIMNALASSAAAYDGNVHDLPAKAQEWGAWVSQQLGPQLAQTFQAQGQIHIQGVQIQGAQAQGMQAPMAAKDPYGKVATSGAKPMAGGTDLLSKAASALSSRLNVPPDQARQAAAIVLEVLQSHGGAAGMGAPAGAVYDPNAKQAMMHQQPAKDPYGKQQPGMSAPAGAVYDPNAKQAMMHQQPAKDPYGKQQPEKDPYGKGDPNAYGKDPHAAQKDPYGKGAPAPQKDPYGKGDPNAYSKDPQGKGGNDWKK